MSSISAKVSVGLAIRVMEEFLKGLHQRGLFNDLKVEQVFQVLEDSDKLPITAHARFRLDPPGFAIQKHSDGTLYTRLDLEGTLDLWVSSPTVESPPLYSLPFSAGILVSVVLKRPSGRAPVLGLRYDGVEYASVPFTVQHIDRIFSGQEVRNLIDSFELDLIAPVIEGLKTVCYYGQPASSIPGNDQFSVAMRLLWSGNGTVDAIGLFIDLPAMNADPGAILSFVPQSSQMMILFGSSLTQLLVNEARSELQAWVKSFSSTLSIKKFSVSLDDRRIFLDAEVKESCTDSEGSVTGPLYLRHQPGSFYTAVDGRDIKIDLDLPWWADVLLYISGNYDKVHEEIPNIGQKYAEKMINGALAGLATAIHLDNLSMAGIPVWVYPNSIVLEDNEIRVLVQILIRPITEHIVRGDFSRLRGRFVRFTLESGREFMAEDLAGFVADGVVVTPGYHNVKRSYMRADPDSSENNNLLKLWGR